MDPSEPEGPLRAPQGVDPVYRFVGNRLRSLRRSKGLRQAEVAKVIGISGQQYQKYEDARSRCSLENLLRLADFLEVPFQSLLPPDLRTAPRRALAIADEAAPTLSPETASNDEAQGQVARLIVAFLAIEDSAARSHLLGLAERLAAQD